MVNENRVPAIQVNNVTMKYRLLSQKITGLKEFFIKKMKKELSYKEFKALDDVSFTIYRGEIVGVIGKNGAGKSTLLKVICGVLKPSEGESIISGSISPLLELGAGFDSELTGRENVFLNGAILGKSKKFLEEHVYEIEQYADLGEFFDVPIKNYSSGMRARLGFSIATTIEPDILLVDEVLGVGDKDFKKKSKERMKELFESGSTVLLVSHSIGIIRQMCHRCIWIEKGKIIMIGDTAEICDAYEKAK